MRPGAAVAVPGSSNAPIRVAQSRIRPTMRMVFTFESTSTGSRFTSVTHFVRACSPLMREGGSIINITSIEAHRAGPGFAVYAAMKAAVANLTKSLALELGERRIRVNCIAPDDIPTPGVGPLAVKIQLLATCVPPSLLVTCLTSVRLGALSLFVMVQVVVPLFVTCRFVHGLGL